MFYSPCLIYAAVLVHVVCNGVIVVAFVVDLCSASIDVLVVVVVAIVVVGRSTYVVICLPWPSVFPSPPYVLCFVVVTGCRS